MTDTNIVWHNYKLNKNHRAAIKNQKPCVIWLTGLSGAGKSTLAEALDRVLHANDYHTYGLDGDNVRHGLNKDLGFSDRDRVENIRRVGEAAKLMVDAGLIVITAFISPFRKDREMVRSLFEPTEFIEVFISTPIEDCEKRDPKGLYKKARAGLIKNFTGIDSPYEAPEDPEINVDTSILSIEEAVKEIVDYLQKGGFLSAPEDIETPSANT
ncbi:adenylyl-sulfate kinase [Hahella ganghwensis]|uniref:adenylyl-sulfate kinase n=1 Tax=Hahella ganghwensis TaxID=286420 RepID=UPI00035D9B29|nr:adenylyl-sulfate kinase [Hahella ganghwensis]